MRWDLTQGVLGKWREYNNKHGVRSIRERGLGEQAVVITYLYYNGVRSTTPHFVPPDCTPDCMYCMDLGTGERQRGGSKSNCQYYPVVNDWDSIRMDKKDSGELIKINYSARI